MELRFAGREACVMILTGRADIVAGESRFESVGGRSSVFDNDAPGVVYTPSDCKTIVYALTDIELAVGTAPAAGTQQPRLITSDHMPREVRGKETNTRFVRNILPETEPRQKVF